MIILLSYILFVYYLSRSAKRKRKRKTTVIIQPRQPTQAQIQAEKRRAEKLQALAEKQAAQREQAESDIGHYTENLDGLYRMQADTMRLLDAAQKEVDTDNQLNKYGAVVPVKILEKHIRQRDRYQSRLFTINNQIHSANKHLRKAERILNQPED